MEKVAKSIESLAEKILPKEPYYLSLSPTRKYRIRPGEDRIDEQEIRPLQYSTFVGGEADRGVLLTRAYFTVREEPKSTNAPMPATLKIDPTKPRKKVSLKDYKNKKIEGDSPPKSDKEKTNGLPTIKEKEETKSSEPTPRDLDSHHDKSLPIIKSETTRHPSASPDRKKRIADVDESSRPIKRAKVGDAIPNGVVLRPPKDAGSQKPVKPTTLGKLEAKDTKPSPITNGKTVSSISTIRAASPKHTSQVNGLEKPNSTHSTHKKAGGNSERVPRAVPKLLSPLYIADLSIEKSSDPLKESLLEPRPSPRKKPTEMNNLKQPKKSRNDREPSPGVKKRKVLPPLLSPTLPPIVMEELARLEKKGGSPPPKDVSLRNSQSSDTSSAPKKAPKSPVREETVHVDSKKEPPAQHLVTMKYKKKYTKTIERLLNLPSGGKKKMESLKNEDQTPRESSGSVEPNNTARKRPRTAEATETLKPPKTSESLRPSTPSKQSTSMSRIASTSSQVDTPGAANSLTPSAQSSGKRREPIAPDKLQRAQRLHSGHKFFMELGTKLKHERDAIMKNKAGALQDRDHQTAVAAGIQSLLLYMHAVKLQSDAFDLERLPRRPQSWREVLPLFPVIRSDCSRNPPLSALLLRIQGICMNYMGRALWFLPNDPDAAEKALSVSKEEAEIWRQADVARRKLGTYDGNPESSDGGVVGKLIDRLGPWTTPEDVLPVTVEVMRSIIHIDGPWKPIDEVAKLARCAAKGVSG